MPSCPERRSAEMSSAMTKGYYLKASIVSAIWELWANGAGAHAGWFFPTTVFFSLLTTTTLSPKSLYSNLKSPLAGFKFRQPMAVLMYIPSDKGFVFCITKIRLYFLKCICIFDNRGAITVYLFSHKNIPRLSIYILLTIHDFFTLINYYSPLSVIVTLIRKFYRLLKNHRVLLQNMCII